jgi:hypothetical protein
VYEMFEVLDCCLRRGMVFFGTGSLPSSRPSVALIHLSIRVAMDRAPGGYPFGVGIFF